MTFGPACDWCGGCSYDGSDDNPRCPWCKKLKSRGSRASLVEQLQEAEKKITALTNELAALRQRVSQPCGVPTVEGTYWCRLVGKEWEQVTIDYINDEGFYLVCKDSECLRRLPGKVIGVTRYWVDWRLVENAEWATCPPVTKGDEMATAISTDGVKHVCHRVTYCTCRINGTEPDEQCPIHGHDPKPHRCDECGKFMGDEKNGDDTGTTHAG